MTKPAFILSDEIRKAFKKIYKQGIRDRDEQANLIDNAIDNLGLWSKENFRRIRLEYIKRMLLVLTKPALKKRRDEWSDEAYQLHLWEDLDQVLSVHRHDGGADGVELGDFGLDEIEARTRQIEANKREVEASQQIWLRACTYVVPLLRDHTDWVWRDAVQHMRDTGGLPDL